MTYNAYKQSCIVYANVTKTVSTCTWQMKVESFSIWKIDFKKIVLYVLIYLWLCLGDDGSKLGNIRIDKLLSTRCPNVEREINPTYPNIHSSLPCIDLEIFIKEVIITDS